MSHDAERERQAVPLHWEPLIYPLPLGAALALRTWQLGTYLSLGEPDWAFRAARLWLALGRGQMALAGADPTGAVTLWASTLGLSLGHRTGGAPAVQDLGGLAAFDPQSVAHLRLVVPYWPAATVASAALNALLVLVLVFLVARLWGARAGLFAGLLLAVSPLYLAQSRVLGPDAQAAGLAVAAVLALLWALAGPGPWGVYLLAGALGGLAALNQGYAAIFIPYGLLLLAVAHLGRRRPGLEWLFHTVLWAGGVVAGALLAYPATWAGPLTAVRALLAYVWRLPQPARPDLATLALRLTPLTVVGLGLAVLRLPFDERRWRLASLALLAFVAGLPFLAPGQSQAGEPGPLTGIVALEVVAAVGLDGAAATMGHLLRGRRRVALALDLLLSVGALLALGWQAWAVLRYHPYYAVYRNPWLAPRVLAADLSGQGEGMDRVAAYLNALPDADGLRVATPDVAILAPLILGEALPLTPDTLTSADYVVLYNRDWLAPGPALPKLTGKPEHVVRLQGVEYARIYANRAHEPILQFLEGRVNADDVIILDATSPFAHHYRGPAPFKEISVASAEQVAGDLNAQAAGCWRLWHVAFAGADKNGIARKLLESQAVPIGRQELPGATVTTYLLPIEVHFRAIVPDQEIGLAYAGGLRLERAGLAANQVQYRQKITLALEWRPDAPLADDLALSLRLVDARGRLWAQQDKQLVDGKKRPTSAWEPGRAVRALYSLAVPPALPPGPYSLRVVVYAGDTLAALTARDAGGQDLGIQVDLLPLEVLSAQEPPAPAELKLENPLEVTLVEGVELLGYQVGRETVEPGQKVPLKLWWRVTSPLTITYQAHIMLLDATGTQRGDAVVELASAEHPTTAWTDGEVIEGRYSLPVAADAASGEGLLGVELVAPSGRAGTRVRTGSVQIVAPTHVFQPPAIGRPRKETLGQKVRLLGYDLAEDKAKAGEALRLTLYWQALAPMQTSYTVLAQLLDSAGKVVAEQESIPAGGARPSSGWVLHEILTDPHEIALPADLPPGGYGLVVGLYDKATGARLPAYDASGARLAEDRISLATITVE